MPAMIIVLYADRPEEFGPPGKLRQPIEIVEEAFETVSDAQIWAAKRLEKMFPIPTWGHQKFEVKLSKATQTQPVALSAGQMPPQLTAESDPTKQTVKLEPAEQVKAIVDKWWEGVAPHIEKLIPSWKSHPQYRLPQLTQMFTKRAETEMSACKEVCGSEQQANTYVEQAISQLLSGKASLKQKAASKPTTIYRGMGTHILLLAEIAGDIKVG